jgi:hypothetical protein
LKFSLIEVFFNLLFFIYAFVPQAVCDRQFKDFTLEILNFFHVPLWKSYVTFHEGIILTGKPIFVNLKF